MTDQAAYIISQSVAALIEALGLHAMGQYRGDYEECAKCYAAFLGVIEKYGLDHGAVVEKRDGK